MSPETLINVRQTAQLLGVSETTVRNWANRGVLRATRLAGSGFRRFERAEVHRLHGEMMSQLARADEGPVIERIPRGGLIDDGR